MGGSLTLHVKTRCMGFLECNGMLWYALDLTHGFVSASYSNVCRY